MLSEGDQVSGRITKKARVAWWNTHLTPPKGAVLPQQERELVLDVIVNLLQKSDILFIGEVSTQDLSWISEILKGTAFDVLDMTRGGANAKFNIGAIHNTDNSKHISYEHKIKSVGGREYKISCRMNFLIEGEDIFSFLISHWPSRLMIGEDADTRSHFGAALRREVDELQNDGVKYLILLGDYNDEPFNVSMTTHLRACRDPAFVTANPELLYNPFWKSIACRKGYARPPDINDPTGTYYYRADKLHRWRVFDQMLFCASFVGHGDWHLNEKGTGVWRYSPLVEAIESSKYKLDHLPILGELEKDVTHG